MIRKHIHKCIHVHVVYTVKSRNYESRYSRLGLIEPPRDRPFLALISGVSFYPAGLFSKISKLAVKSDSNKRRDLLTGELLTEVYCITISLIMRIDLCDDAIMEASIEKSRYYDKSRYNDGFSAN